MAPTLHVCANTEYRYNGMVFCDAISSSILRPHYTTPHYLATVPYYITRTVTHVPTSIRCTLHAYYMYIWIFRYTHLVSSAGTCIGLPGNAIGQQSQQLGVSEPILMIGVPIPIYDRTPPILST